MTPQAWVAWFFASIVICGALFLALAAFLWWLDDCRAERGYKGGTLPVSEYRQPPKGPAPGVRK